jgi:hypothetical protein
MEQEISYRQWKWYEKQMEIKLFKILGHGSIILKHNFYDKAFL